MSEPKWTPGPLTVRKSRNGPVYYIEAPTKDGDGTWLVAEVTGQGVENEANAHLLGSSQDLYEVADMARQAMEMEVGESCAPDFGPRELLDKLLAVLAKARGEAA